MLAGLRSTIHSQDGEDGLLEALFARIGGKPGYFVEFGAWDGRFNSNTFHLYESLGWTGCYIEGDAERFKDLLGNVDPERIEALNVFVMPKGGNSLDAILSGTRCPKEFDVLSIDIDSDDHAIWKGFTGYRPKIVIIEYNPTIPNSSDYVQPPGSHIGNSAGALYKLGRVKGYDLIDATKTNLIFCRTDLLDTFGVTAVDLATARPDVGHVFFGYDGSVQVTGRMTSHPWTGKSLHTTVTGQEPSLSEIRKLLSRKLRRVMRGLRAKATSRAG
ncbi:hypothetical protein [Stappia sp.]|uniref:hypothetical protein n=1 Tax=Stappia sp. TaxID=1870903 RepID=UPI003A990E72